MPTIVSLSGLPNEMDCGDHIEILAKVSFKGDPRDVTLIFEIGPSCTFSGGAHRVSMRRFGPSPQTFRFMEQVRCPTSPRAHIEEVRVIATDILEAADQVSHRMLVNC